jgi:LAGLIDADG endonuclease
MITWQYLAGFFDGEGCVNYANSGSKRTYRVRLTFSQAFPRGLVLLNKIKAFLEANECKLGKVTTSGYRRTLDKQGWQLQVTHKASTKKIMEAMLPHLEIKKVEVQDALRRQLLYPSFLGR